MSRGKFKIATYTTHNKVRLVRGGQEYFSLLEKLIDEAEHVIHLHTYIYDNDETGQKIADALTRAAARGVKVYVLVDGYASGGLQQDFRDMLKAEGVFFSFFEPFIRSQRFYVGRRLHYKVFVADNYKSLVGGINISNRYNDMPGAPAWLDFAVYTEGEASGQLADHCVELWNGSVFRGKYIPVGFVAKVQENKCIVKLRRNDWVNRKTEISQSYMELFSTASSYITLMSSYFWPGRGLLNKMMTAAAGDVKIKLILAGTSDIKLAKYAERYIYRKLLKKGIEIFEYQGNILHGKVAVCDDREVTIGSYNVNNISAYASVELNLEIKDMVFADSVNHALNEIIIKDCLQVTEESFVKHHNIFQRIGHQLAFEIVHILFFLFTFYFKQKDQNR